MKSKAYITSSRWDDGYGAEWNIGNIKAGDRSMVSQNEIKFILRLPLRQPVAKTLVTDSITTLITDEIHPSI